LQNCQLTGGFRENQENRPGLNLLVCRKLAGWNNFFSQNLGKFGKKLKPSRLAGETGRPTGFHSSNFRILNRKPVGFTAG
jgi:hypothetical protein